MYEKAMFLGRPLSQNYEKSDFLAIGAAHGSRSNLNFSVFLVENISSLKLTSFISFSLLLHV